MIRRVGRMPPSSITIDEASQSIRVGNDSYEIKIFRTEQSKQPEKIRREEFTEVAKAVRSLIQKEKLPRSGLDGYFIDRKGIHGVQEEVEWEKVVADTYGVMMQALHIDSPVIKLVALHEA